MLPEPDSLRPPASGTRTHHRRTMHLRQNTIAPTRRVVVVRAALACLVLGACAASTDGRGLTVITIPSTTAAHSPTESPVPNDAVTGVVAASPTDGASGAKDASAYVSASASEAVSPAEAFTVLARQRVACLTNPQRCDVADFTAPGSSEAQRMSDTVARFRRDGLRLSPHRGRLELTVNAVTLDPASGDVVVDSCERDSHVLVDARFTAFGEIIVDESVVTTRARWHLVDTARSAVVTGEVRDRRPTWRVSHVDIVTRRHGGVPCSQL